ncbi:hypothetical protein ACEPAG_1929 [Sanghuangporus baumii]
MEQPNLCITGHNEQQHVNFKQLNDPFKPTLEALLILDSGLPDGAIPMFQRRPRIFNAAHQEPKKAQGPKLGIARLDQSSASASNN